MINLLLGPSGGGKSYEAVVFQILPALQEGRKVITNLPINLDEVCKIEPQARSLLELRYKARGGEGLPFATPDEFGDTWRHPVSGCGPLYVIDECHKQFPRARTSYLVDEWFAEHRHELCDVLLITQSYGKISKAIIDNVQVCYKVKKATAFGQSDHYWRKVLDGVNGGEMAVTKRTYEKRFFKLYKSHTKSLAAGQEADAKDISPRYRMLYKVAALIVGFAFLLLGYGALKALHPKAAPSKTAPVVRVPAAPAAVAVAPGQTVAAVQPAPEPKPDPKEPEPFDGMGIHILGRIDAKDRVVYVFALSLNGQPVRFADSAEIRRAGYELVEVSDCVAKLRYASNKPFFARCDVPQQSAVLSRDGNAPPPTPAAARTSSPVPPGRPAPHDAPAHSSSGSVALGWGAPAFSQPH